MKKKLLSLRSAIIVTALVVVIVFFSLLKRNADLKNIFITLIDKQGSVILIDATGKKPAAVSNYSDEEQYVESFFINNSELGVSQILDDGKMQLNLFDFSKTKHEKSNLTDGQICIRYSPSGRRRAYFIYNNGQFFVEENGKKIYEINDAYADCTTNQITWLSEDSIIEKHFSRKAGEYVVNEISLPDFKVNELCHSKYFNDWYRGVLDEKNPSSDLAKCLETSAEKLFGSKEWPVEFLIQSTDSDRYYFYRRWFTIGEHIFPITREWIEGYDKKTERTFHVYTLRSFWGDFMKRYF